MKIKFDFNNIMSDFIGNEDGISEEEIESLSDRYKEIDAKLKEKRETGEIGFFDLARQKAVVGQIIEYADHVSDKFKNFVSRLASQIEKLTKEIF